MRPQKPWMLHAFLGAISLISPTLFRGALALRLALSACLPLDAGTSGPYTLLRIAATCPSSEMRLSTAGLEMT